MKIGRFFFLSDTDFSIVLDFKKWAIVDMNIFISLSFSFSRELG